MSSALSVAKNARCSNRLLTLVVLMCVVVAVNVAGELKVAHLNCPGGTRALHIKTEDGSETSCITPDGAKQGPYRAWRQSGRLSVKGEFKEDKREGSWMTWYPSGGIYAAGPYRMGMKKGIWRTYYENGTKESEIEYRDDEQHGRWAKWYRNGKQSECGQVDGVKIVEPRRVRTIKEIGHWTYFYENGRKEKEGAFRDGRKDGLWVEYYPNGKMRSEGTYDDERRDGRWTYWQEDGQLVRVDEYQKGRLLSTSPK